ncbi:hypothetical protein B0919_16075 [Hymenobacter sp. CRA2]|nr:hypothetical protein B0919_16075 [Hymenobacter sp. CRA2]
MSTDGYTVNISVEPVSVVPSTTSCTSGYNFDLTLNYRVTFSGTNIPGSLWNLQARVTCSAGGTVGTALPTNGGTGTITTVYNQYRNANDCSTATVASLGCNTIAIDISGPGIANQTISCPYTSAAAAQPLPVTLVRFGASAQASGVLLTWTTATELNNDYFTVERSADATTWQSVAQVHGAGNATRQRSYTHLDPAPAGRAYYRLKQTDFDGTATYSAVQSVLSTTTLPRVSVAPNPSHGRAVQFNGLDEAAAWTLRVRSAAGQVLGQAAVRSAQAELPVLPAGVYFLELHNPATGQKAVVKYCQY